MKIMPLQTQNFCASPEYYEVKENRDRFYELSTDQKLNVLFDTLNNSSKKLASNQVKMQEFNKTAIKTLFSNASRDEKRDKMVSADRLCQLNTIA
ncbi:MAG: hypothetical protein KIC80_07805 [Brachyspira sp.]|jgi:hypothetical protein|nr:hypothetical protein [Brachyspira sp.]